LLDPVDVVVTVDFGVVEVGIVLDDVNKQLMLCLCVAAGSARSC